VSLDVRTITDDEVVAWVSAMRTGFLGFAEEGEAERRRGGIDVSRTYGSFDGSRIVGTYRSFASELTVPGGASLPTSCVTNVTVTATHRRRGLLTRMMTADLVDTRDRGEPLAALISAEWPIYGRFGYGAATEHVTFTIDVPRARFTTPATGFVEMTDAATMRIEAPKIYERVRLAYPGGLRRLERWWDADYGVIEPAVKEDGKAFMVLGRDEDGVVDAYAHYRVKEKWEGRQPHNILEVREMMALDASAASRMWQYFTDIDWIRTVTAEDRGPGDPLPWLLADGRAACQTDRNDFVWVRIVDAVEALAGRTYLVDGRVVIEIVDQQKLASGRYVIEGGPAGATCSPTTESAALTAPVEVVGAVYLGGHTLHELAGAGLVDVHDAKACAIADAMFRSPVAPWCNTWF
jgi:predicted acetyltransferase